MFSSNSSKLKQENLQLRDQLARLSTDLVAASERAEVAQRELAASHNVAHAAELRSQLQAADSRIAALERERASQRIANDRLRQELQECQVGADATGLAEVETTSEQATSQSNADIQSAVLLQRATALPYVIDSPMAILQENYADTRLADLETYIHKLHGSLGGFCSAGKAYATQGASLAALLSKAKYERWASGINPLCEALSLFGRMISEFATYLEVFMMSTESGLSAGLQDLQQRDIAPVRALKSALDKARTEADTAVSRALGTKRTKGDISAHLRTLAVGSVDAAGSPGAAPPLTAKVNAAVSACKRFETLRFEYSRRVNDVEVTKRVVVLQNIVSSLYAARSYFSHCAAQVAGAEPTMRDLQGIAADGATRARAREEDWRRVHSELGQAIAKAQGAMADGGMGMGLVSAAAGLDGDYSASKDDPHAPLDVVSAAVRGAIRSSAAIERRIEADIAAARAAIEAAGDLDTFTLDRPVTAASLMAPVEASPSPPQAQLAQAAEDTGDSEVANVDGVRPATPPAPASTEREVSAEAGSPKRFAGAAGQASALLSSITKRFAEAVSPAVGPIAAPGDVPQLDTRGGAARNAVVHAGYLWKRSSNLRRDWQKRWFFVREGRLFYVRGAEDMAPQLVTPLVVANTKSVTGAGEAGAAGGGQSIGLGVGPAGASATTSAVAGISSGTMLPPRPEEAEPIRPYIFEVRSPQQRPYELQAATLAQQAAWVTALRTAGEDALVMHKKRMSMSPSGKAGRGSALAGASIGGSGGSGGDSSAGVGAVAHDPLLRQLQQHQDLGNQQCTDCGAATPDWASINTGALLCVQCAGVHRSLGVHVSKVRSVTLDSWEPTPLALAACLGNDFITHIWEAQRGSDEQWAGEGKPVMGASRDARNAFIRAKWEGRAFALQAVQLPQMAPCAASLSLSLAADTSAGDAASFWLFAAAAAGDVRGAAASLAAGAVVEREWDAAGSMPVLRGGSPKGAASAAGALGAWSVNEDRLVLVATAYAPGRTALHAAAWGGNPAVLELLLQNSAPGLHVDSNGMSAFDVAAERQGEEEEGGEGGGTAAGVQRKYATLQELVQELGTPARFTACMALLSARQLDKATPHSTALMASTATSPLPEEGPSSGSLAHTDA